MTPADLPTTQIELWGVLVIMLGSIVTAGLTAWITNRAASKKIEGVAQDAKATRNQVSNGQKTLMRDDLVSVRDTVLCLKATLTQMGHSVTRIEDRQINTASKIGAINARLDDLSSEIAACPAHPVKRTA